LQAVGIVRIYPRGLSALTERVNSMEMR